MLQRRTIVGVIDNSLIKKARIHHIYNKTGIATVGDKVRLSVLSRKPNCIHKKGDVIHGLVVRTAFPIHRQNGSTIKYSSNDIVILNSSGEMLHNTINGIVFKEYNSKYQIVSVDKAVSKSGKIL